MVKQMDSGVIWDDRNGKIIQEFNTFRGAKGSFKRTGRDQDPNLVCSTREQYLKTGGVKAMTPTTVISLQSGKPVQIPRATVGTCCDPSTERYWSM